MARQVAFVLGGGAYLGAAEVGMLGALFERGIRPDLVVGTSVGAIHGAAAAADPTLASVEKLESAWSRLPELGVLGSWRTDVAGLVRLRTHVRTHEALRRLLAGALSATTFEELAVHFSASRPASSVPPSTGSPRGPSSTRSSPRRPFRACCRRSRSTGSTSSRAGS